MRSPELDRLQHHLQQFATKLGCATQDIRTDYLLERLVCRLTKSEQLAPMVFKGGFVSRRVYNCARFTRDIDVSLPVSLKDSVDSFVHSATSTDLSDICWFQPKEKQPLIMQTPDGGETLGVILFSLVKSSHLHPSCEFTRVINFP